jgi:hypothetical protein
VLGALCGGMLAPLQLLLWPELRISAVKALLAFAAWASWGAFWVGIVAFLFVEAAGVFAPGIATGRGFSAGLWWPLAAAGSFSVAAIAWWNRDQTHELLAADHRDALGAAVAIALLLTIATAVASRRPAARRRPLLWFGAPAVAALLAVWTVWASSTPSLPPPMPPRGATLPLPRKVMLVSWEGADLTWLLPAIEQGDMPFLRSLRDRGAWGQLRTAQPYSRTAFFATLATSCLPSVHGVIGRRAYRLPWLSETPVSLMLLGPWPVPHHLPWRAWERAAPPPSRRAQLWEILARAGLRVGVAGWPGIVRASWAVPQPMAAEASSFASLGTDVRTAVEPALAAFPDLAPPTRTAFAIAANITSSAQQRLAAEPVEALVLNTDLAARVRPLWTFDEAGGSQADVLRTAARFLDAQLKLEWTALGGDEVLVALVSPYGLAPPSAWRRLWSSPAQRSRWRVSPAGTPDGFVLLSGPGVKEGVRLRGSRLADVTATILYLLELPVARDMSGRVMLDAVSDERAASVPLRLIPSYGPPEKQGPGERGPVAGDDAPPG